MRVAALLVFLGAPLWADWSPVSSGTLATLHGVRFFSGDTGHAFGDSGTLLRTTDRGSTWKPLGTIPRARSLSEAIFLDSRMGVILLDDMSLSRTEDGGQTWAAIPSPAGFLAYSLGTDGRGNIFAGGAGGTGILRSTDTGRAWSFVQVEGTGTSPSVWDFHFPTKDTGYASCTSSILRTLDGGKTWALALSLQTDPVLGAGKLVSVFFIDGREGVVARPYYSMIARTEDGAQSFTQVSGAPANAVAFLSPDTGYAACNGGRIYRSTDRGRRWSEAFYDGRGSIAFRDLCFPARDLGFAVGSAGTILRYQVGPVAVMPGSRTDGGGTRPGRRPGAKETFDSLGKKSSGHGAVSRIRFRRD